MRAQPQRPTDAERELAQARFSKDWVTPMEAAEIAGGVTDATVRGWIESGDLCALNIGTARAPRYKIRLADLEACMQRRTKNADAAA